jgi:hypothetical protein
VVHPNASEGRESAATALVKQARLTAEFFHSGEECFATVDIEGHLETYAVRSRGFRSWLGKRFFEEYERAASGEALTSAITTLEGFARFQAPNLPVYLRVAGDGERVFVDLCDDHWRIVEINARGYQIIDSNNCPVRFRRAHGMQPLPLPAPGGSLVDLARFLNLASADDLVLVIGWIVGALHPSGPYAILILHGEQGSAKTTTARVLRDLLDPNVAPVRSEPREPRDLMVAANNGWVCAFDNMSALPGWFSDALCRLSTGGGFGARTLYTDQDETVFFAKRPSILTGIEELATRGDLLDRAIVIYLPRIQRCTPEGEFFRTYEASRPKLLGALFNAVSSSLANSGKTFEGLPRMADFAAWVVAAESSIGWTPGSFLRAYQANRAAANDLSLETPVAEAVLRISVPWMGTASELLKELDLLADERAKKLKTWPGSGRALSNALRRLAPNLREVGLCMQFSREPRTGRRLITLSRPEDGRISSSPPSPSSLSSRRPDSNNDAGDAGDAGDDRKRQSSEGIIPVEEEL